MKPSVSIGMPVYNAERYIAQALDSLLDQTYEDFELVIGDNASTDATAEICRSYVEKDERIQYVRNRANYGVLWNFNNVFRLTHGRYFKWAAYDDLCAPEFLAACVEALDRDPSVVLACSRVVGIDAQGKPIDIVRRPGHGLQWMSGVHLGVDPTLSPEDPDPTVRWRFMMRYLWWTPHLYGVIRSDALARTKLHVPHFSSDHILLAELALLGRFEEIPDDLLYQRFHSARTSETSGAEQRLTVARPGTAGGPTWLALREALVYPERFLAHASSIRRAPLSPSQRLRCYEELMATVVRWAEHWAHQLPGRLMGRSR